MRSVNPPVVGFELRALTKESLANLREAWVGGFTRQCKNSNRLQQNGSLTSWSMQDSDASDSQAECLGFESHYPLQAAVPNPFSRGTSHLFSRSVPAEQSSTRGDVRTLGSGDLRGITEMSVRHE